MEQGCSLNSKNNTGKSSDLPMAPSHAGAYIKTMPFADIPDNECTHPRPSLMTVSLGLPKSQSELKKCLKFSVSAGTKG